MLFRKPRNPGYKEFKPEGVNKASNVEVFLTEVETVAEKFIEPVEPIKLCLVEMERYADDIEYKSHEERCTNDVE